MKKRKRRKLTKEAKRLFKTMFIILIIIFLITYIKKINFSTSIVTSNSKKTVNYEKYITSKKTELDNVTYISHGMSLTNFKKIFEYNDNYVDKDGSYTQLKYNFEKLLTYKELEEYYKKLNKSKIVTLEIMGQSTDGRNIYSLTIGKGSNTIMLEGNIHAAEIAPTLFLIKYMIDIVNNYEKGNKEINELLENNKIIILPSINPDGYDYTINGKSSIKNKSSFVYQNDSSIDNDYFKANINGVDINRNLPSRNAGLYNNIKGKGITVFTTKSSNNYAYYSGDELGSENESITLLRWIYKYLDNAKIYASVHSAGRVIYSGKPDLSQLYNTSCKTVSNKLNKITSYISLNEDYEEVMDGSDGTSTDIVSELKHGFKYNEELGRLVDTGKTLETPFCALTIETLEKYTKDINIIKEEYTSHNLEDAFNALIEMDI